MGVGMRWALEKGLHSVPLRLCVCMCVCFCMCMWVTVCTNVISPSCWLTWGVLCVLYILGCVFFSVLGTCFQVLLNKQSSTRSELVSRFGMCLGWWCNFGSHIGSYVFHMSQTLMFSLFSVSLCRRWSLLVWSVPWLRSSSLLSSSPRHYRRISVSVSSSTWSSSLHLALHLLYHH